MTTFLVLLKKEILEQQRTKKLLVTIFIFLFVDIGSPIFAKLTPQIINMLSTNTVKISVTEPTYIDSLAQFVKNISQLAIFVLIFVVAGAISDEKSKKTLELLLVKPVSKTSFVFSKFISYFLTITVIYTFSSLIFYFYSISLFSTFSFSKFLIIAALVLIYILLIVATTIFASAISKSNLLAGGIGFIGLIIYPTLSAIIPKIDKYLPNYVIGSFQIFINGSNINFLPSLLVSFLLIALFILLAIVIFNKQEISK